MTQSFQCIDSGYTADVVQWCPFKGSEDYLALGTYQLVDEKRKGSISIFKLTSTERPTEALFSFNLEKKASWECPGVFHLQWVNKPTNPDHVYIASVQADCMFRLQPWSNDCLEQSVFCYTNPEQAMYLYSDVEKPIFSSSTTTSFVLSDQKGYLTVLELSYGISMTPELIRHHQWKAHDYEAWVAIFDPYHPNTVYSGGDDTLFKRWDTRMTPASWINRSHSMGVTHLQCHPSNEWLLISGSYDEHVRLWDKRSMKNPLTSILLYGGVWRCQWHPTDTSRLAAACMHHGFHLLVTDFSSLTCEGSYLSPHPPLAYGIDWHYLSQSTSLNDNLLASCSFYDHTLHLWKYTSSISTLLPSMNDNEQGRVS